MGLFYAVQTPGKSRKKKGVLPVFLLINYDNFCERKATISNRNGTCDKVFGTYSHNF
jgi:hypothetical protein